MLFTDSSTDGFDRKPYSTQFFDSILLKGKNEGKIQTKTQVEDSILCSETATIVKVSFKNSVSRFLLQ
jgi:hypothetical protein